MRILTIGLVFAAALVGPEPSSPCSLSGEPTRLAVATGFAIPESARFDPDRDAYFVSNVNAHATAADNNGFISLVGPDGTVQELRFIAGGQKGVTLHAPKGMAIRGADLWVADVTMLRSFNRRTGAPGPAIDFGPHGAIFLNDVAVAPDDALFVSDTSFVFGADGKVTRGGTDRVYRVDRSGAVTIAIADPRLEGPNGVFWDRRAGHLLIASLSGKNLYRWTAEAGLHLVASGPGGYDGIEALADGTIVVSSQDLPGILRLDGASLHPVITGVSNTGDIGVDPGRARIAIPRLGEHVVELWQLPR